MYNQIENVKIDAEFNYFRHGYSAEHSAVCFSLSLSLFFFKMHIRKTTINNSHLFLYFCNH